MPGSGQLFVISAPSGAGKTSLVNAVVKERATLKMSVSHTTRPRRPNEENGREYHFVDIQTFKELIARGAFLEHAQVFDNRYGTGRDQVNALRAKGLNVLLEIDWQGARQVRLSEPECISIFILPPSRSVLEQRLRTRATDSEEVIARRLAEAASDMGHCFEFDYVVVNDRFEQAVQDLLSIIDGRGEALGAKRPQISALLPSLVS